MTDEQAAIAEITTRFLRERIDWPAPLPRSASAEDVRDLYRGCLLWGAVGDALGRPAEGLWPAEILRRYGADGLRHYQRRWRGGQSGPKGAITDDTQLTIEVARSLLAAGGMLDPTDLSRRLVAWLPHAVGEGRATRQAVLALSDGAPWWTAGLSADSGGNGAAMRAAPVGLAHALEPTPDALRRDAILSAYPTHTHPVGVGGAVAMATAIAWCVRARLSGARNLDPEALLGFVARAVGGIETEPSLDHDGGRLTHLRERVREVGDLALRASPEEAFAYLYNGAFALQSVPSALYCFLRAPDDPAETLMTAVYGGHDADSVAAMAGNLAGAWCGASRLEAEHGEWSDDVEYHDDLIALADSLTKVAVRASA